ncbi:hypothetical protein C5E45_21420 [Nocardia nova]|uniref:ESX-1 secretion-associated protein n=1 Tax=Nocardia nova TaxID=37330 RepID=A0A2S6AM45_9NOCA|nr:hypothetical protein [Nocardia nova]PPJ32634.1 hypothetical protein C5E41_05910 [Nocardia nova]PPJ36276.1 hypothetical protein C5E45_21420 [Nocardia nova]
MSTANGLWQQAVSGTFRLEADAAQRCARVYTRFVEETLEPQIDRVKRSVQIEGFGGFDSARQLQGGFVAKSENMIEALNGMRDAAVKMAAAYLRAGNLIADTDADNKSAIKAAVERGKR